VQLALEQFSLVQLREQADRLDFYLTNYRTDDTTPRTDTLRIVGATATPTYTYADRGNHTASRVQVVSDSRGYALAVTHLGPFRPHRELRGHRRPQCRPRRHSG